MDSKRILIVDDNAELRETLCEYLSRSSFQVDTAVDGEQMHSILARQEPDLIILDVMLPGDDGFTLCSQIRRTSMVPIIMLTAVTDEIDRITGLELGADDYITKTFNPRELLARIKALLRRTKYQSQTQNECRYIKFSRWCLDIQTRVLILEVGKNQQVIRLSGSDYKLLELFVNNPNQPLSRNEISLAIYGRESMPYDRSIDILISRLRSKLADKDHSLIRTLRNEGYLLASEINYA